MNTKPRVALVTNVLPHYRIPSFDALSARWRGEIDYFILTATMAHRQFVMAQAPPNLNVQVLPGFSFARPPFDDVHFNDPRPALAGYDLIVLSGWDEPTFLLLWLLAQLRSTRIAFWIESTLQDAPRNTWKEGFKRMLLKRARGALVMGTNSAAYCAWLGMPASQIFIAPNAADSAFYAAQARTLLPTRATVRAALGMTGIVVLFVGRMVEYYKNISVLLRAQQTLQEKKLPVQLVLVGEGPDRAAYEKQCAALGLSGAHFINFQDRSALARYYAGADIFVLPSRSETWGLVLNEAMEFGLPIVTTSAVGAAPDLVQNNGFVVPPGDAAQLANALETLVRDPALRAQMGAASRHRIAHFTPSAWAEGFARGLEALVT